MTHFELFFCVQCEIGIVVLFLHMEVQLLEYHLWKRLSFPHQVARLRCQKSADQVNVGLIPSSMFSSINIFVSSYAHTTVLNTVAL